jgi:hypothetical protein
MSCNCREPTLEEILSDPTVRAVMAADAVDPRELEAMLEAVARTREQWPSIDAALAGAEPAHIPR